MKTFFTSPCHEIKILQWVNIKREKLKHGSSSWDLINLKVITQHRNLYSFPPAYILCFIRLTSRWERYEYETEMIHRSLFVKILTVSHSFISFSIRHIAGTTAWKFIFIFCYYFPWTFFHLQHFVEKGRIFSRAHFIYESDFLSQGLELFFKINF